MTLMEIMVWSADQAPATTMVVCTMVDQAHMVDQVTMMEMTMAEMTMAVTTDQWMALWDQTLMKLIAWL
tara:strand:- start:216 stop:422 length:207 start_codon:yes stop_codon:yes gene_type:complete